MTLPAERTRAVQAAERFLMEIASGEIKGIPQEVREHASRILRHYPCRFFLSESALKVPDVWGPPT